MNILYVGDNRNRVNWGCRATSLALGSLLSKSSVMVDFLGFGKIPVACGGLRPISFWKKINSIPSSKLQRALREIKKFISVRDDFVELCPDASISNFRRAHESYPVLQNIYRKLHAVDAIVINGEGSYIFTTPPRHDLMFFNFLLRLAQKMGKRTFVLNSMFSDCPRTGRNELAFEITMEVLANCDAVAVRDPHSLKLLHEGGLAAKAKFYPDALFTWSDHLRDWEKSITGDLSRFQPCGDETYAVLPDFDFDRPYICLSGSSSAALKQSEARPSYARLAQSLARLGRQVLITPACEGDAFLADVAKDLHLPYLPPRTPIRLCAAIVGKAEAFVSGRFHPAILASNGGTPCVFMGANSHKMLSLQHMLEYESPFEYRDIPSEAEIEQLTERTRDVITSNRRQQMGETARKRGAEAQLVTAVLTGLSAAM